MMAEGGSLPANITWEEKLSKALEYKQLGNEKYKSGNFKQAIGKYHRALLYLKGIDHAKASSMQAIQAALGAGDRPSDNLSEEAKKEVTALQVDCYNNLAAVLLKMSSPMYEKVVFYCDCVLEFSPQNIKALFRKGVALYHLKTVDVAMECLTQATKQPGGEKDASITKYLQLCEKASASQDEKMKKTYKQMFEKMAEENTTQDSEAKPQIANIEEVTNNHNGDAT
eukprot:GHVU01203820.1.p1 GENE.GHVU01203820.1~~GHVU01203820.1.p1  ORF type:complete len:226 (+),score=42.03 GHVU01203820.1:209-886(+)